MKKSNELGIKLPKTVIFGEPTELKLAVSQKVMSQDGNTNGRALLRFNLNTKERQPIRKCLFILGFTRAATPNSATPPLNI